MVSWKRKAAGEHSFRITPTLRCVRFSLFVLALALSLPAASAQFFGIGGLGGRVTPSPPSSELTGMAYAGVAMPSDGAGSFLLNPARLASVEPGVSASLLGRRLAYDFGDAYANAYSLTAGFAPPESPLRFGLGFGRSTLDLGEQIQTDEMGNEAATFDYVPAALVLGGAAQYDGPISVAIGLAARRVSEPNVFRFVYVGSQEAEDLSGWGVDFGLQVRAPIVRLRQETGFSASAGVGYAIQNWGGSVEIDLPESASGVPSSIDYPLAAIARLGWSATLGYDVVRHERPVRAVQLDLALEASHSLTRSSFDADGASVTRTAAPLGRIRPLDALLGRGREADVRRFGEFSSETRAAAVVGYRGVRVALFEALTLRAGTHTAPYTFYLEDDYRAYTWGAGLSAVGLFRFFDPDSDLSALGQRGDLRVDYAYYSFYEENDNNPDPEQPWSLGLTLVARWP